MSAEKAKLSFSSGGRPSQSIFTLSNVFVNHPSSRSPGKINHISFERNGFVSPIIVKPVISCFRNSSKKSSPPPVRTKSFQNIENEVELELGGDIYSEFDSEFEALPVDDIHDTPALRFVSCDVVSSPGKLVLLQHVLRIGDNFPILTNGRGKRRYVCKYCGDVFQSGCAMGGHISKVHRGCSNDYRQKKIKSKAKKNERERARFLRHAVKKKNFSCEDSFFKPFSF